MPAYMSGGARTGAKVSAAVVTTRVWITIGKPRHEHGESGEKQDKNDLSQHLRSLKRVRAS
jgi:hypothetical protein